MRNKLTTTFSSVTKVELTDGIVAAIRHGGDLIQITAPISHGSSGSPVLTDRGKLIGVAVAGIFLKHPGINLQCVERRLNGPPFRA